MCSLPSDSSKPGHTFSSQLRSCALPFLKASCAACASGRSVATWCWRKRVVDRRQWLGLLLVLLEITRGCPINGRLLHRQKTINHLQDPFGCFHGQTGCSHVAKVGEHPRPQCPGQNREMSHTAGKWLKSLTGWGDRIQLAAVKTFASQHTYNLVVTSVHFEAGEWNHSKEIEREHTGIESEHNYRLPLLITADCIFTS